MFRRFDKCLIAVVGCSMLEKQSEIASFFGSNQQILNL